MVLLLVLLMQWPSAGYTTAAEWSRMASLTYCRYSLLSGEPWFFFTWPLQLASSGSEFWVQQKEGRPQCVCNLSMVQSQLRFQKWPNRLYLWMEGATKSYCKGVLIEKLEGLLCLPLQTIPQKAKNKQEKNRWGEGHT